MLKISNLFFSYGKNKPVFQDFSSCCHQGEIMAIMGPSGVGKSTLLHLIAGFLMPSQGEISLNHQSLQEQKPHQRPVSILFQQNNLFAHLNVWKNIALGLHTGLSLSADDKEKIEAILTQLGLQHMAHRMPDELSGGQQQRVALARVLLRNKPLLLLDEPFTGCDAALRQEMLQMLAQWHHEHEWTTLMVTHAAEEVKIANHVLTLSGPS